MYMTLSIKATIADVKELDRLRKIEKLSRSQYIRAALDHYNVNPVVPIFKRGFDLTKGEPTRPINLMLEQKHIDIINLYQTKFKATKVQIIRQALIEEAAQKGETFNTITLPTMNPKWEGIWVKASAIYGMLGMHRNTLYQNIKNYGLDSLAGLKRSQHVEQWYRLTDIIRMYRLDDARADDLKTIGGLREEEINAQIAIATALSDSDIDKKFKTGVLTVEYIDSLIRTTSLSKGEIKILITMGILNESRIEKYIQEGKLLEYVEEFYYLGVIKKKNIQTFINQGIFTSDQLDTLRETKLFSI